MNISLSIFTTSSLTIHLLHLGCFHFLAIINSVAINIEVHISFQITVFFFCLFSSDIYPGLGFAGSYGGSVFSFLEKAACCFP